MSRDREQRRRPWFELNRPRYWLVLGWTASSLLPFGVSLSACRAPPRSPSCEVAAFLCVNVPCDDGGPPSVENCPQLGLSCESARDACPRRVEVAACLEALAGATLTCNDADICFTGLGCRWVGVFPNDGGLGLDGGGGLDGGTFSDGG